MLSLGSFEMHAKNHKPVIQLIVFSLAPLLVYTYIKLFVDHTFNYSSQHFYTVSIISVITAILATFIGIVGTRLRNFQVILVAFSYSSLGILFALRSLEMAADMTSLLIRFATPLGFFTAALWLLVSSFPAKHGFAQLLSRFSLRLIFLWLTAVLTLVWVLLAYPKLLSLLPERFFDISFWFSGVIMFLNFWVAWRYYQLFRYTQAPLHYAIIQSSLWIAVSQLMIGASSAGDVSCWAYHGVLLAATLIMVWGVVRQFNWTYQSFAAIFSFNKGSFETKIQAALSPKVRQLIKKTEEHDYYTAGHNWRVAMLALKIGEAMNLAPEKLHALAYAGVIHDIGKLNIPSEILNKPGKLDEGERRLIEQHPDMGHTLCQLIGFLPEELAIVRHHHEKWDGSGYPAKLAGEEIPLVARITALADVYDALTSNRSYRKPMTHEQAHSFILEHAGSHFCPVTVNAWTELQSQKRDTLLLEPEKGLDFKLKLTMA